MNDLPFVLEEFITSDEANSYVDYIERNLRHFRTDPSGIRHAWMFGKDNLHTAKTSDQTALSDITDKLTPLLKKAAEAARMTYGERELYTSMLWFAKQEPGAIVAGHTDGEDGSNTHVLYSGVLYLNDMEDNGSLDFPNLDFSYTPRQGGLVLFPAIQDETYWHEVTSIEQNRYSLALWFTADPDFELTINGVQ
jgi:hypothetical protein